ncbi:hypothetical protein K501DRAFT_266006 [Backusella circina FSU 941]|nr:hypothetical protein K501DRAFT_266006 [Backusella circina FSU 941]
MPSYNLAYMSFEYYFRTTKLLYLQKCCNRRWSKQIWKSTLPCFYLVFDKFFLVVFRFLLIEVKSTFSSMRTVVHGKEQRKRQASTTKVIVYFLTKLVPIFFSISAHYICHLANHFFESDNYFCENANFHKSDCNEIEA